VAFVDCGVTTKAHTAGEGRRTGLVALAGGTEAALDAAQPLIEVFADPVFRCGGPGAGMATKLARNVLTYGSWAVTRAALGVLSRADADAALLADVVAAADPEGRMPFTLELVLGGADAAEQRRHTFGLLRKDLLAARAEAEDGLASELIGLVLQHAPGLLGVEPGPPAADAAALERGRYWLDHVYGEGFTDARPPDHSPQAQETLTQLFAEIWSRPGLSVRDRRLLVMGVTARLGRGELLTIQALGGLRRDEFTPEQLLEMPLQLAYYVGWGDAGTANAAIKRAIEAWEAERA
jgi:alkylhydroperoxidase/carboxymuconolactone decarboxylase family protein YurZ